MISKNFALLCAVGAMSTTVQTARADSGSWSAALVGFWSHPTNGNVYHFYSDATYTLYRYRKDIRADAPISYSGWWKIVDSDRKIALSTHGPVRVRLKARTREVMRGGRRRTLKANGVSTLLVSTPADEQSKRGQNFIIDGVPWSRAR